MKYIYLFSGGSCVGRAQVKCDNVAQLRSLPAAGGTPHLSYGKILWVGDYLVTSEPVEAYETHSVPEVPVE